MMLEMEKKRLQYIKTEIRIVGVDDGFFVPREQGLCDVIGVVFRGGYWLDGVMRTKVDVDGRDATEKIGRMILDSPHYGQLRIVMLNGVTFAGFNVVDAVSLFKMTKLPVIAVTREKPDFAEIHAALNNLAFAEERWKAIRSTDRIVKVFTMGKNAVFIQMTGIAEDVAKRIVKKTATRSSVPEPLRVAHLIAAGLTKPIC